MKNWTYFCPTIWTIDILLTSFKSIKIRLRYSYSYSEEYSKKGNFIAVVSFHICYQDLVWIDHRTKIFLSHTFGERARPLISFPHSENSTYFQIDFKKFEKIQNNQFYTQNQINFPGMLLRLIILMLRTF